GEKSRLVLAKVLINPPNLILMDEPTNHLDIPSRDILIKALKDYTGSICFISHDVHFIRAISNKIVEVDNGTLTPFVGGYDYYREKKKIMLADMERLGAVPISTVKKTILSAPLSVELPVKLKKANPSVVAHKKKVLAKKIAQLDDEIKTLHANHSKMLIKMASSGFYKDPTHAEQLRKHREDEERAKILQEEWMKLSDEMECFGR
ncbi:MAG: hypothetical protein WCI43_09770, partial [Candidatus Firestonebacteria bacterium]